MRKSIDRKPKRNRENHVSYHGEGLMEENPLSKLQRLAGDGFNIIKKQTSDVILIVAAHDEIKCGAKVFGALVSTPARIPISPRGKGLFGPYGPLQLGRPVWN
jgi:hypothetical protein